MSVIAEVSSGARKCTASAAGPVGTRRVEGDTGATGG
jgi:hypothetical protein